jgi:hypothetical protein
MSMVGEVEALTDLVCPSRVSGSSWPAESVSTSPDPHGIALPSEAITRIRSRYSVHGSRFAVSTALRSFGHGPLDTEASKAPVDSDFPTGFTTIIPPESCAAPATLMGFPAPFGDIRAEVH